MMLKAMVLSEEQVRRYSNVLTPINDNTVIGDGNFGSDGYIADCKKLQSTAVGNTFTVDNGGFTSTVNLERENLVFYAVPYEDGWSATVDGKPVRVEKANVGFMAVLVPAGEHTVRFNYMTPGLKSGAVITVVAAVMLIAYIIVCAKLKSKNPDAYAVETPEIDALRAEADYADTAESEFTGTEPTRDNFELSKYLLKAFKKLFGIKEKKQ